MNLINDTADIQETRLKIAALGQLMFDRLLTDTAGGNISARVGDLVCITMAGCGSNYRWRITPEQVLVTDLQGNVLLGEGKISREAKAHYRLYQCYPAGQAVVHCHARNVLVFACAGIPLAPCLEGTLKFGTIPVCQYAPAHSDELAEHIAASMQGREGQIAKMAALTMAPWHGLFSFGKNLDTAFDAADRTEVNAHVALQSRALGVDLPARLAQLEQERIPFLEKNS
jgi:L-fuculose-phosphate aldolase